MLVIFLSLIQTQGCVTYESIYDSNTEPRPQLSQLTGGYRIKGGTIFSGEKSLKKSFQSPFSMFSDLERSTRINTDGFFIDVSIKTIAPSAPALVFGYISFSLLGLTPVWSTEDGYEVFYEIYQDGKKLKTFVYQVSRHSAAWLPMIIISPINLSTTHEAEAFEQVINQFKTDLSTFQTTTI